RLRQLRRERDRALGPVDLGHPRVRLARRNPLRLDPQWKADVALSSLAEKDSVVPGVAGGPASCAIRPLLHNIGEDRANVLGHPARAQGKVERVHAEIAQAPIPAVELGAALPVDRLLRAEVARL